jgi:hypothetical protein
MCGAFRGWLAVSPIEESRVAHGRVQPTVHGELDRVPKIRTATGRLANHGRYKRGILGEPLPRKLDHPTIIAAGAFRMGI